MRPSRSSDGAAAAGAPRVRQGSGSARAPDIVLLAAEWPARALLRAQLIEEGFDVLAVEAWPAARHALRPGFKPALVIVDLQGLPDADSVLRDLSVLMKRAVLVIGSTGGARAGGPSPDEREALGITVVARPVSIGEVVRAASRMIELLRHDRSGT